MDARFVMVAAQITISFTSDSPEEVSFEKLGWHFGERDTGILNPINRQFDQEVLPVRKRT